MSAAEYGVMLRCSAGRAGKPDIEGAERKLRVHRRGNDGSPEKEGDVLPLCDNMHCDNMAALQALGVCSQHVKAFLQDFSLASLQKSCAIVACFPYNTIVASPVQMRSSSPVPLSATPADFAIAHPQPAASAIVPQHAASSGPSAVQMTSQRHHAYIPDTMTAMLPSDASVAQAPVTQRRVHKRRAQPPVTASQIT